jgi:hypothetical protein
VLSEERLNCYVTPFNNLLGRDQETVQFLLVWRNDAGMDLRRR